MDLTELIEFADDGLDVTVLRGHMSPSDGHFNRALYDDNVTGKFNQLVDGRRRRATVGLEDAGCTSQKTVVDRHTRPTSRHRLDVAIIFR